jgi:NodT family efflux transporter outer membrane factor (OMF) lipoprotein
VILSGLETELRQANQNIALAEARFRAARAALRVARADYFPTVSVGPSVTRSKASANRGVARGTSTGALVLSPGAVTDYDLPVDFSYEADVWGRVRRNVESNNALLHASAADLGTAILSMEAELATDYFQLRGVDAEIALLQSTVEGYQRALQLTVARHDQGIASGVDVAQAETQLATVRAQATDLSVSRAQLEHAIAVLVGRPPAGLTLLPSTAPLQPPPVPASLPSSLLERRPDVAAAERRAASANALIGVAQAAFFPSVALTLTAGFQSTKVADWLTWPSRFWSVGASIVQTIFDGGRRRGLSEQARANFEAAVAIYRQDVLAAFQDVEDNLAASRILAVESGEQLVATQAAERALALANERYQSGITTFLEVITAQNAALSNERVSVQLLTRRMTASVQLVKALGGGWRREDMVPPPPQATPAKGGQ